MPYGAAAVTSPKERIDWFASIPFLAIHLGALAGAILAPPSAGDIALVVGMYYLRMWGVVVGYHRYLSHRTFSTSRWFQFVLVFLGGTAVQKGGLWWAANHRHHHRFSDQPEDVHSPVQKGFLWSHVGWILSTKWNESKYSDIKDMAKYPELRFLNEHHLIPPVVYATVLTLIGFAFGGMHGAVHAFVWGFLVSTTILWHGTFTINSLSHVFGRRRFKTTDDSRNSLSLALLTMGEGWHNNHHYFPGSMSQGFYWWQIDIAAYIVRALQAVGLVWDVRSAPEKVKKLGRMPKEEREAMAALAPPVAEPAA